MELTTGIINITPGWRLILKQIGIPFREIKSADKIIASEYPIIILCSKSDLSEREVLRRYTKAGGAIVCEAHIAGEVFDIPTRKAYIRYLQPEASILFSHIPICDLAMKCDIAKDSQYLRNQNNVATVAVRPEGNGRIVVLPSGFNDSVMDYRFKRKNFPAAGGKRFPSERVSLISKGTVRHIIARVLKHLFHSQRLPFVHLWNFPGGNRSIFSFRVDSDFASQQEVEDLYRLCRNYRIPATWFVETKTQENWVKFYSEMEDQEIGYHCYRHRIFRDYRSNLEDMKTGLAILERAGIIPAGYAAPFGEWSPLLARIQQEFGFIYSSEFTLAYDDLPFEPIVETQFAPVLQVPIHPISVRGLFLSKHTDEQMLAYYLAVARQKILLDEPVIFYHHPSHKKLNIFEGIFKFVRESNITTLSMEEYAAWWQKRNALTWSAKYEEENVILKPGHADGSLWVRIDPPDGSSYIMHFGSEEQSKLLELPGQTGEGDLSYHPSRLRKLTWRMLLNDLESFYGKMKQ